MKNDAILQQINIFSGAAAIVSTGWLIKIRENQYGSLDLPNKYFNPLRLLQLILDNGFCGELLFQVRNTSSQSIYILEGEPIGIITIIEYAHPHFKIVNSVDNPSEKLEPDSTTEIV